MDLKIIRTQSGDWEVLYINGILHEQGHKLGEGNNFFYLLELSEKFKFKRSDIKIYETSNEDEQDISNIGSFPRDINKLKGIYN